MAFVKEVIITLRKKIAHTAGSKLQQFKNNGLWLMYWFCQADDLRGNMAYLLQFLCCTNMIYLQNPCNMASTTFLKG